MACESDRKAAERVPGCLCTRALSDLATQRASPPMDRHRRPRLRSLASHKCSQVEKYFFPVHLLEVVVLRMLPRINRAAWKGHNSRPGLTLCMLLQTAVASARKVTGSAAVPVTLKS
jgi:hypothetical protein